MFCLSIDQENAYTLVLRKFAANFSKLENNLMYVFVQSECYLFVLFWERKCTWTKLKWLLRDCLNIFWLWV